MIMNVLLAGGMVLLSCRTQEPSPADRWKSDFTLNIVEQDDEYVFVIEGTTDLPPGVELRARVYAVTLVDDFRSGKREDEEPLVWEDDGSQVSYKVVHVRDGKFREKVYRFRREPWALKYRARLHYRPQDQTRDDILKLLGGDELSWPADFQYGSKEEYAAQMVDRVAVVTRDLEEIEGLYNRLKKNFLKHRKLYDALEWKVWKNAWYGRVQAMEERNEERYKLWAVWMERQSRMRVGGMCELFRRVLADMGDYFTNKELTKEGRAQYLKRIEEILDGFHDYFEEAVEVIGVKIPLDPVKIGPIVRDYQKALAPLRGLIEDGEGDPKEVRDAARQGGSEALLRLPLLLKNRKSAYTFVNDLSLRFRRLLDLVESRAKPEALAKALAHHDETLRDFRKLSGLE